MLLITTLIALSFVSIYILVIDKKLRGLLVLSFIIRLFIAFVHNHIFRIPSIKDDETFELVAYNWSLLMEQDFGYIVQLFDPTKSYVISWIGSIFYLILGRNPLLLSIFNIFLCLISIVVLYNIVLLITKSSSKAYFSGLLFALHPTVIENSSVFLRESLVILFLLLAVYALTKWYKYSHYKHLLLSLFFIIISSFFHGGMIFGLFIIVAVFGYQALKNSLIEFFNGRIPVISYLTLILVGISAIIFFSFVGSNTKLQLLVNASNDATSSFVDVANYLGQVKSGGDSAYLVGVEIRTIPQLILYTPLKVIYFLFSPFPWDISKFIHIKGFIDSIFIFITLYIAFKNREVIRGNQLLMVVLFLLIGYVLVFSLGTSNFGTAIRHKTKLLPLFIILMNCKPWTGFVMLKRDNRPNFYLHDSTA